MGKEFEIVREFEVDARPDQVWEAVTAGTAGWLWPMEYEPREGGAAPYGGVVAVWEPGHRFVARNQSGEGADARTVNQIEHLIEPREGGRAWVRYVHSGILEDDWDNQYDGADKHTDFYLHTLRQYLAHFPGRAAAHVEVQGPEASTAKDAFEAVARALGVPGGTGEGESLRVDLPGAGKADAVVDYRDEWFIGLRTGDAMYRFFGRNTWGGPVGVAVHLFSEGADAERERTRREWQAWLDALYV
ncbi:SRPBCC family protein [Actinomadura fibrosa]|uniref:SRPBCC domain-containing protein n=1 Tax=Actinomadura fibrosa TaxID=111802 RepID=A0ABW2XX24_9ACTN|nr:SRPBCC domain-containing protein [Actinomadura fibrosa]